MPDWEPAPPSAELRKMAATFRADGKAQIRRADLFDRLAADVDGMERDLAKLRAALAVIRERLAEKVPELPSDGSQESAERAGWANATRAAMLRELGGEG